MMINSLKANLKDLYSRFYNCKKTMKIFTLAVIAIVLTGGLTESNNSKKKEEKSYKILVMVPFASKSHIIAFIPLLQALAQKGHQLTYVSMLHMTSEIPGTEEIVLEEISEEYENLRPNNFLVDMFDKTVLTNISTLLERSCNIIFQSDKIKNLMERKFDLAIVDSLMGECVFPIIHKLQVPFISLCTTSLYAWVSWDMDVPTPLSYVPQAMSSFTPVMSFKERLLNTIMFVMFLNLRNRYIAPTAEKYIYQYFPDFPGVREFVKNTSLVLTNSHPTMDNIRPSMPFVIEVGGMHCKPGKPLPKNLADFVEGAGSAGFIFFSLGSNVRGTDMPQEIQKTFIEAFSKLPERVIWKFEAEMGNLPPNVMVTKWAPQQDLLAHRAVKLFMTHAGQLSTQEAVYHAVPVIGMPLYADQMGNIANLKHKGMGESLDHQNINVDIIYNTIRKIIDNKSYKENAEKYSERFKDRPQETVKTAVYWVEYVIRHKGAHFLKSTSQHLNFIQYFLIDIFAFIAMIVLIIGLIVFFTVRFVFRKIRGFFKSGKKSKKD